MFVFAFLVACAAETSFRGAQGSDTAGLGDDAAEVGACAFVPDGAAPEGVEVIFARGVPDSALGDAVVTVEDAAAWEALRAQVSWGTEPPPSEPDFAERRLLVLSSHVAGTCSLGVAAVELSGGAVPHVSVVFEDRSGACEVTCEAEGSAVVVVSVPRSAGMPSGCATRVDTCDA